MDEGPDVTAIRSVASGDLDAAETASIRTLLAEAFGAEGDTFDELDWQHALGGTHVLAVADERIVGHAAIVERTIHIDRRPFRTGYVEAVATATELQGGGIGSRLMDDVGRQIRAGFELGALSTGRDRFYARLGWETWQGRSYVRLGDMVETTPDDDGSIMVLRTAATAHLDLSAPIVCEWRPGDVW